MDPGEEKRKRGKREKREKSKREEERRGEIVIEIAKRSTMGIYGGSYL